MQRTIVNRVMSTKSILNMKGDTKLYNGLIDTPNIYEAEGKERTTIITGKN
jgi:hypothetical protein